MSRGGQFALHIRNMKYPWNILVPQKVAFSATEVSISLPVKYHQVACRSLVSSHASQGYSKTGINILVPYKSLSMKSSRCMLRDW